MFPTTYHVKDFDDAIQSRISVALHYGPLGFDTRKIIWKSFLERAATAKDPAKYTPKIFIDWPEKKSMVDKYVIDSNMCAQIC